MQIVYNVALPIAFGVLHAVEPGHGKTALLAYVADKRRTVLDSAIMGLSTAVTHTMSIFLIALSASFLFKMTEHQLKQDLLTQILGVSSSLLLIAISLWIYKGSFKKSVQCCDHHHEKKQERFKGFLLGLSIGALPCPTVLAAFLVGSQKGNMHLALMNVVLFGLGMFITLFSFGLFAKKITNLNTFSNVMNKVNVSHWAKIQALVIFIVGVIALYQSIYLPHSHLE
jgi:ABC-type nickel/cobalt efflux system permease component RcnA